MKSVKSDPFSASYVVIGLVFCWVLNFLRNYSMSTFLLNKLFFFSISHSNRVNCFYCVWLMFTSNKAVVCFQVELFDKGVRKGENYFTKKIIILISRHFWKNTQEKKLPVNQPFEKTISNLSSLKGSTKLNNSYKVKIHFLLLTKIRMYRVDL